RDLADAEAIVSGRRDDRAPTAPGAVVCSVREVALKRANGSTAVSGVSLDLRAGEIVAVAGVDGNGQSEFVRTLAGMARPGAGVIECLGARSDAPGWTAAALREKGVAHVPEDRRRAGIVGGMSLSRNYFLRHMTSAAFVRLGLLREQRLRETVASRLSEFQVKSTGPLDLMERLSGGNQQKVVLAREMDGEPRLVLAAHPSRGLDIKTIRFVHQLLMQARDAGKTVLLLSSDLDEIMQLADRIVVFAGGRMFGPAARGEVGRDEIGAWIAGHAGAAA
ncbi:MAG: ATP-binding cassette domain-containing protein, partial [Rhizobiaceae bacterium]|nr:ATP-binding cassette domain-containing protein [Rhizobiaceae bacterium]